MQVETEVAIKFEDGVIKCTDKHHQAIIEALTANCLVQRLTEGLDLTRLVLADFVNGSQHPAEISTVVVVLWMFGGRRGGA